MTRTPQELKRELSALRGTFTASGISATLVMSGVALENLTEWAFSVNKFASSIAVLLTCLAISFLFFRRKQGILDRLVRSEARVLGSDELIGRRFLIMGMSRIKDENRLPIAELVQTLPNDPSSIRARVDQICRDKDLAGTLEGWQQNLRALNYLKDRDSQGGDALDAVYIIDSGTRFNKVGAPHILDFLTLVRACFPGITFHVVTHKSPNAPAVILRDALNPIAPDYENYSYASAAFDRAFQMIAQDHDLPRPDAERSTYIDVTSGTKVFSIAAAIQTLNRDAIFVYVTSNTNVTKDAERADGYAMLGYDADAQFTLNNR